MPKEKEDLFADEEDRAARLARMQSIADGLVGPDGEVSKGDINVSRDDCRALGKECEDRRTLVPAKDFISAVERATEQKARRVKRATTNKSPKE